MYRNIYNLLEQDGYAEKMVEPKFFDILGQECKDDDSTKRFGHMGDLVFKHHHLVFVGDECGTNTIMLKDKMSNGDKRCTTVGSSVTLPACTSDSHYTTFALTILTGEPVFVLVIFRKENAVDLRGNKRIRYRRQMDR